MNKTMSDMLNSPDLEDVELALIMCRQMKWNATHVKRESMKQRLTGKRNLIEKYIIKTDGYFVHRKRGFKYKWIKDESES